jgi:hypothetical protein
MLSLIVADMFMGANTLMFIAIALMCCRKGQRWCMGDSPKFLPLAHADRQLMCRTRLLPLRAMFFGNALACHHWLIYRRKCAHDYCFHSRLLSSLKDNVHEYETHWNLSLSLMLIANG